MLTRRGVDEDTSTTSALMTRAGHSTRWRLVLWVPPKRTLSFARRRLSRTLTHTTNRHIPRKRLCVWPFVIIIAGNKHQVPAIIIIPHQTLRKGFGCRSRRR